MSDNNYRNFIYLFNDQNFINVKQDYLFSTELTNKYQLKLDFKSIIVEPGKIPFNGVVYSPETFDYLDYPRINTSILRDKQQFLVRTKLPDATLPGPPLPTISNDPFHSPHKKVLFDVSKEGLSLVKYFPSSEGNQYSVQFTPANEALQEGFFYYDFFTQDITRQKYNPSIQFLNLNLNSPLVETDKDFLYMQTVPIAFEYSTAFPESDFAGQGMNNIVNYYTQILNSLISYGKFSINSDGTGFSGISTADANTMVGVPYDIHTMLEKDMGNKQYKYSLQPRYEKLYNFYDPQYEPLVEAILDQDIINERSLPSIYDFLFLENDFNSIIPLIGLPGLDSDDINLSNLNQYLDTFGNVYGNYLQLESDGITVDGLIGEDYFDNNKNFTKGGSSPTYNPDNIKDINQQVIENSKIPWSGLTSLLKQLPSLAKYTTDIKRKGTPLWLEELKTGVYFSEKSIKTFNQTLDKDNMFPFLVKVNIPTEQKGKLAKIFSQNDILDAFNTYAASLTIPTPDSELPSTVQDFYGAVINGDGNKNFNLFSDTKMTSFKMYFEDQPNIPTGADLRLLSEVLGENSPVRQEFLNRFMSYLIGDFSQYTEEQLKIEFQILIAKQITEQDISDEMREFLNSLLPETKTVATIISIILSFLTIRNYKKDYGVDLFLDTLFYIGDESLKTVFVYKDEGKDETTTELSSLLTQLKIINFKKSLKDILIQEKLLRTPVDVQNGKFAHQETLMYEIAKYGIDDDGNENYIQSIFLPITNESSLNYYDTQIIPRKRYQYKIFAHKVILGTDYEFVPYSNENGGNIIEPIQSTEQIAFYNTKYEVKPFFQFVRVPYYNTSLVNTQNDDINYTIVDDKPPLPPLVNFVPYQGVNNKLLVLMNNSIGEVKQFPIIMFEEDKQKIMNAAIAQEKKYMLKQVEIDGELVDKFYGPSLDYKSDDQEGTFQAYRIDNEPTSYRDFEKDITLKVFELNVQGNFKNDSFQDDIVPNKDYYYTFRFEDLNGKVSNPTEVYKVRMTQAAASAPYLRVEIVDTLKKQQEKENQKFITTKVAQKYIMIKPSEAQNNVSYSLPNGSELIYDEDGFPTNPNIGYENVKIELGDSSKSVFGRKFKLRMTSKQTGKKIDVNFTVEQPEDVVNETGNVQYEKT